MRKKVAKYRSIFLIIGFTLICSVMFAQDSKVNWSSFNSGFAEPTSSVTNVKSVVGQSFIGKTDNENSIIESGFLVWFDTTRSQITPVTMESAENLPEVFRLYQNYPNPFNPETTIQYQLANKTNVVLEVFNINGQVIRVLVNEIQSAGQHTVKWDGLNNSGTGVTSGTYFLRLKTFEFTSIRKLTLLK